MVFGRITAVWLSFYHRYFIDFPGMALSLKLTVGQGSSGKKIICFSPEQFWRELSPSIQASLYTRYKVDISKQNIFSKSGL